MAVSANYQTKANFIEDACCKKSEQTAFACKLTSPEMRERKATVIAGLKDNVMEKKELKNGFAYRFSQTGNTIAELNSFIKDEKECCEFLSFKISADSDKKDIWLEISGADGVKEFINAELEM